MNNNIEDLENLRDKVLAFFSNADCMSSGCVFAKDLKGMRAVGRCRCLEKANSYASTQVIRDLEKAIKRFK